MKDVLAVLDVLKETEVELEVDYRGLTTQQKKKLIKKLYVDEQIGMPTISKMLGISYSTVREHLLSLGVRLRTRSEARKLRVGPKSPRWSNEHPTNNDGYQTYNTCSALTGYSPSTYESHFGSWLNAKNLALAWGGGS